MSRPTNVATALGRLQTLIGKASNIAANDRNPNRQAQLQSVLREAFAICVASRSGEPLPEPVNHDRAQ
jgi:hypothetical protein